MNEYRFIFDYLYSKGIYEHNVDTKIQSLAPERLFQITNDLIGYTNFDRVETSTHFNFMSNSRMSGYNYLDTHYKARLENVNTLMRDSLLFADVLWIKNPLNNYFHCSEGEFYDQTSKSDLANDIKILYQFRLLLETGLARICGTEQHFCHDCLMSSFGYDGLPKEYQQMVSRIEKLVKLTFRNDVSFQAHREGERIVLQMDSNRDDLFVSRSCALEFSDLSMDQPLDKAVMRKSKRLYKNEIDQCTTIYCELMRPIIDDVLMYNWFSNQEIGNLSYLTNRDIDVSMIEKINSRSTKVANQRISESLKHTLPTILNVPIDKIVDLRRNESESFVNYRDSYDKLLRDVAAKNIAPEHVQEALYDTVMPNINKLNVAVRNGTELAGRGLIVNAVFAVGTMACGLVDGFLPEEMKGPLMAVGVGNFGKSITDTVQKLWSSDSSQRENQYYFLWKLTKV